ncbi:lachesin-like [Penaeus indicus]|uniref:lachesin-like n=1 Tax=Penaeus indicus TaxID=29960 RepID=UPI00300C657C
MASVVPVRPGGGGKGKGMGEGPDHQRPAGGKGFLRGRHLCDTITLPPTIQDAHSSQDVEVREGEEARLSCGATGTPTPTILWRREDARLIRLPGGPEPMWRGSTLAVKHARREDAGAYLCIANNGVPPSVSKRVRLNVRFEPVVRAGVPSVSTLLGGSVNISCFVDAWPTPTLHWVRDNGDSVTSQPYVYHLHDRVREVQKYVTSVTRINDTQHVMSLGINDMQTQDLFGYRCRANNSEGAAEARVLVKAHHTLQHKTQTGGARTTATSPSFSSCLTTLDKDFRDCALPNLVSSRTHVVILELDPNHHHNDHDHHHHHNHHHHSAGSHSGRLAYVEAGNRTLTALPAPAPPMSRRGRDLRAE